MPILNYLDRQSRKHNGADAKAAREMGAIGLTVSTILCSARKPAEIFAAGISGFKRFRQQHTLPAFRIVSASKSSSLAERGSIKYRCEDDYSRALFCKGFY